ncbi:MAG: cupin domain-containing protein [Opitutaceae bacterium]|nr:cupin domain-containing protein [Opitutaceae bacterium]
MSVKTNKSPRRPAPEPLSPEAPLAATTAKIALAAPVAAAPSPRVREALLARIRGARAAERGETPPPGWRFDSAHAAAGWRATRLPGVRLKTLSVDDRRDVVQVLIEMAPGATFPDHTHVAGAEEGLVLSGDIVTGGRLMRAGDYYHAAEGSAQGVTVSPSGCTGLLTLTARAWKQWREALAP